jgi:hypothetical protein
VTDTFGALLGGYAAFVVALAIVVLDAFDRRGVTSDEQ